MSAKTLKPKVVDLTRIRAATVGDRVRKFNDRWARGSNHNEDRTSSGDPLKTVLPSMLIYPNAGMITGNGAGPVIGRGTPEST